MKKKTHKKYTRAFQAKTCLGCKAYQNDKCILKYKIILDEHRSFTGLIACHKPIDWCEKPLTHLKLKQIQNKK